MKKIEAIIRKSSFEDVKQALHDIGIDFFTYWDVTGVGNEKQGHIYRGVAYSATDIQRRYLSIVVSEGLAQKTIDTIIKVSRTGHVGDGKIFIYTIEDAYRIRTGENGSDTLI